MKTVGLRLGVVCILCANPREFSRIRVSSQYFGDEDTPSRRFPRKTGCAAQTFGTFPLFFGKIRIRAQIRAD